MTTEQLISELSKSKDIKTFLGKFEEEFRNVTYSDFLNDLLVEKDLTVAQVARLSGQGDYVYKVFNNKRRASRNIAIRIAVGMKLSVEETQLMLRIARFAILDARDKRDSVIIYGIEHKLPIDKLIDLLSELNQPTV